MFGNGFVKILIFIDFLKSLVAKGVLGVFSNIKNGYVICNTHTCLAGICLKIFPELPLASHIPCSCY